MKNTLICTCIALAAVVGLAWADVKTETFTRTSLLAGIGNVEVTAQNVYQADKRAEAQTTKMVGGVVGALAGKPHKQTEITRLDKDLIWDIDHGTKSYTERPIKPLTEEEISGAKVRTETRGSAPASRHRVTKSAFKVEKTAQTKNINGFPCTEYLMTWELELEDTVSKEKVGQVMTTDMWNTPLTDNLKKAQAVEEEFNKKLAAKMGIRVSADEMQNMGLGMMTATYGVDAKEAAKSFEKAAAELSKIEGYSIVTEVTWRVKPDSAALAREKAETEEEEPASSGGLRGMLANKIAKAVVKDQPKEKPDILFSSYHEVKSVTIADVPAAEFEVPAGYKKSNK